MKLDYQQLLNEAMTVEGAFGDTFTRFYSYSFMNQLLLQLQGVKSPVATYKNWASLGRQVKKGSKAKEIIRPVMVKDEKDSEEYSLRGFKMIKCIFELNETEGEELTIPELPKWNKDFALNTLGITMRPFDMLNGNIQGYARGKQVSINPTASDAFGTLLHELAHIVLGHTDKENSTQASRGIKEFQAETVRYITQKQLGNEDNANLSESRAYLQQWLGNEKPSDEHVKQIFKAVDSILKAGRPVKEKI
jgi:hypothetical protein